jgi:hypothetical protein
MIPQWKVLATLDVVPDRWLPIQIIAWLVH